MSLYMCENPEDIHTTPGVNLNYGFYAIMMCQCRFTNYSKHNLVQDMYGARGGGAEHIWEISYFLLSSVHLKLL